MQDNWNVIPINSNSKLPSIKWKDYITKKYPRVKLKNHNGNLGVITGKISNNLVILDLDYRGNNKQHFSKIFGEFGKAFPRLARTYVEETPNGHHFFYYIKDTCPKRKLYQDTKTAKVLTRLERTTITKFPYLLKGVDVLGENGYSLITPSEIDNKKYKAINNTPIMEITETTFNKIVDFFILDTPERKIMRKPFRDILNGDIEIEEQAISSGKSEHVYWKYVYIEAWHYLKLYPQEIFPLMKKNQPAFDTVKTFTQLQYVNLDDKPMTSEKIYEYFPQYKPKRINSRGTPLTPPLSQNKATAATDWERIADGLILDYDLITMQDTGELMVRQGNIYSLDTKEFYKDLAGRIRRIGYKSYSTLKNHVMNYIKDTTKFDRANFCFDNWIINFQNGYYDVITGKFRDNRYHKGKIFCYEIPHEYKSGNFDCPLFEKSLSEWLAGNSVITKEDVYEMIGYSMTMNTNLKTAFFIYGEKNSGKTTYQSILEHLIGHKNRKAISLQRLSKDQFGTYGLQFKILNMVGDMSSMRLDDVSIFKVLTGGDKYVEAEKKGGKQFTFRNIVKIWYNANEIPSIRNNDDAFYSRWILTHFANCFPLSSPNTETNLNEKICGNHNEVQAILHKCVEGADRLYKRGYFRQELSKNSRHIWRYEAESLYAFLYDNCEIKKNEYVTCDDFIDKYTDYLFRRKKRPNSRNAITSGLERHNVIKDRLNTGNRDYIYKNITWKKQTVFSKYRKI